MDVFSHPWLGGLFSDPEVLDCIDGRATLDHMLEVEAAYARALGEVGAVSSSVAQSAASAIRNAAISPEELAQGTARDGVSVPALVAALKREIAPELHVAIHNGMTSQDVIDTALILSLRPVLELFENRLHALNDGLNVLDQTFGARGLMGRTRMQAAQPIHVSDRIAAWRAPLERHHARLAELRPKLLS